MWASGGGRDSCGQYNAKRVVQSHVHFGVFEFSLLKDLLVAPEYVAVKTQSHLIDALLFTDRFETATFRFSPFRFLSEFDWTGSSTYEKMSGLLHVGNMIVILSAATNARTSRKHQSELQKYATSSRD